MCTMTVYILYKVFNANVMLRIWLFFRMLLIKIIIFIFSYDQKTILDH